MTLETDTKNTGREQNAFASPEARAAVKKLLYLRLDGIGDVVISNLLLEGMRRLFPNARVIVACDTATVPLFEASPAADAVLPLDKTDLCDADKLDRAVDLVRAVKADALFNGVLSPTPQAVALMRGSGAAVISTAVNAANLPARDARSFEQKVAHLIPQVPGRWLDIERHADMLAHFGFPAPAEAKIWLSPEAGGEAEELWRETGFTRQKTVAFFAAGGDPYKMTRNWGPALAPVCREKGLSVAAFGGAKDARLNEENLVALREAGVPAANLCGRASLLGVAAFMSDCRLVAGADTGLAHIACALDLPLVVLLPGAQPWRFFPYQAKTTVACLPLDCYGCNWNCRFERAWCVRGVTEQTLAGAINHALTRDRAGRTLYLQPPAWQARPGRPNWLSPGAYIESQRKRKGNPLLVVANK